VNRYSHIINPKTLNPKPLGLNSEIRTPKAFTLEHLTLTPNFQNPKPKTLNPKPQIESLNSKAPNPKPSTLNRRP